MTPSRHLLQDTRIDTERNRFFGTDAPTKRGVVTPRVSLPANDRLLNLAD